MLFDFPTVLSVTTGRLFTKMENIYKILSYMTGEEIYTHQIPRFMDECRPYLLDWFPEFRSIDQEKMKKACEEGTERIAQWIFSLPFPSEYEVNPLPPQAHVKIDPLAELVGMVGQEKVIVVKP
jgi:hypothetical protein